MRRYVLRNIILLVLINLMVKPFYILGIDAEVQNRVGAEVYGGYFALLNLSYLFNILLDLGTANYATRFLAQSPAKAVRQLSSLFLLRAFLVIPYLVATVLIYLALGYPLEGTALRLMLLLAMGQVFSGVVQFARSGLTGLHVFGADRVLSVLDRVLLIGSCGFFLWGGVVEHFRIELFVELQAAAYGLSALVAVLLLSPHFKKITIDWGYVREAFRNSLPFAWLALLMMTYTRVDAVMLERMLDEGAMQAGFYAQGFRLLDALNTFALLISVVLLPVFSRMIARKQDVSMLTGMAFRMVALVAIPVAVIGWFWPEEILSLRYVSWIAYSAQPFQFLMITFVGAATTYVYGTLLTAKGDLAFLNKLALAGLLLNVTTNYLLIPEYGAAGAGFTTMMTQCLIAMGHVWRSRQVFKLAWNVKLVASLFLFVAGLALVGYFSSGANLDWKLGVGLTTLVIPVLALVFRLIPRLSDIRKGLKG